MADGRRIEMYVRDYLEVLRAIGDLECDEYFAPLHSNQPGAVSSVVRNIAYGLDHFEDGLVVDVGSGHGLQAYVFAMHGHEVVGVDMHEQRMAVAMAAAEKLNAPIRYELGDATEAVRGLSAASIWMHRAIGHLRLAEFLPVAHETLSPNGTLVFMTSNARSRKLLIGMRRGQKDVAAIEAVLESHGFDVEHLYYHGYVMALPARYRPDRATAIDQRLSRVPFLRALGGSFSMSCRVRPATAGPSR